MNSTGDLGAFANARGVVNEYPFPLGVKPFDARAKKWRLTSQELLETNGRTGQIVAQIKRVFQYAPGDLTWDVDKNGGEFTWK